MNNNKKLSFINNGRFAVMSTFDPNKYKSNFNKQNYTECKVRFRDREAAILSEYSQNLNISKNALLQKCLVYCYENMIDVIIFTV
jgi:hypothetical protein